MPEGELLIARFGPWSAERCEETAREQHAIDLDGDRKPPRYGISVFGDHLRSGEELVDVVRRICSSVPVSGKKVAVITAAELHELGWEVYPDMPPPMHYLLGQRGLSDVPDVESLALVWAEHKIDNPAYVRR